MDLAEYLYEKQAMGLVDKVWVVNGMVDWENVIQPGIAVGLCVSASILHRIILPELRRQGEVTHIFYKAKEGENAWVFCVKEKSHANPRSV